ncbi:CGNR zinc finger domain-containing protein [Nonomuraea sp. NPDC049152]|uniref:CGNR zinc finger domain-containing protein n=1 Tax=Nonomuraea sp. NPDC049152 TaxID=3154350 RepID=UPI0033E2B83D
MVPEGRRGQDQPGRDRHRRGPAEPLTGRRRWCSMESCGNRAKVGRFSQRARDLGD